MAVCRERCPWAAGCDLPGSEDLDPYMCPRADKLAEYWHESRDVEEWMRKQDMIRKYDDEPFEESEDE